MEVKKIKYKNRKELINLGVREEKILRYLLDKPNQPVSQARMAEALHMDRGTASRTVKNLISKLGAAELSQQKSNHNFLKLNCSPNEIQWIS